MDLARKLAAQQKEAVSDPAFLNQDIWDFPTW